ncbi:class A sortase [Vagococcus lutrae]|uniref:class A sortase n=1 Tax=Vagococcus lutrae TaxID=81947 RepID=UPI00200D7646|nr:class A sortase [Vagococcus lutrae]UQF71483.1 class A sortase [Vagococcus lutrae]
MRKKQSDYIVFVLMFFGISILFYPFFKMSLLRVKLNQTQYIFKSEIETPKNFEALSQLQPPTLKQVMKMKTDVTYDSILKFPSLEKNLTISNDTNDTSFLTGVVNMYPQRNPLEDNIVILGHHLSDSGLLLGDIGKLKMDDKLTLIKPKRQYEYKVSNIYITDESNVSILDTINSPKLTIVTCDKPNYTEKRLVVEGQLINVKEIKNEDSNERGFFSEAAPINYSDLSQTNHHNHLVWLVLLYTIIIILMIHIFL